MTALADGQGFAQVVGLAAAALTWLEVVATALLADPGHPKPHALAGWDHDGWVPTI